jgi:tetratricopeptide (TPR) repeat protein
MAVAYALATCAYSQSSNAGIDTDPGDPGTGGVNAIDGKLYYPGGRTYDRRIQVKLRTASGADQFTFTDTNGAFTFRRLRPGTYYIVLDAGSEFEPVNETVDVIASGKVRSQAVGQTLTVQINLQPTLKAVAASPRTVSARGSAIPEEAATCYKEAIKLSRAGDRNKAIEQLKKALSIYPEFMLALNELGVQYLRLRQPEKAADALQGALKISPDAFAPELNYGIAMVRMKKYDAASMSLKKAVDQDGSSAAAHLYLGEALIGLGDYDKAKLHLARAIEIGGDDGVESRRYLAAAYIETGLKAEAARELETYLSLNPKADDADKIKQIIHQLRTGN